MGSAPNDLRIFPHGYAGRMDAQIALVRHGQTEWNAEGRLQGQVDIPLNRQGRAQARTAGAELISIQWDVLVSSPLGRAVETASLLGADLGLEISERLPDLMERNYGAGEGRVVLGMSREKIDAILETAEPEAMVAARGIRALGHLVTAHPGMNLVVVAHGTLLRLTLEAVLGRPHPRIRNCEAVLLNVSDLENVLRDAGDQELAPRG